MRVGVVGAGMVGSSAAYAVVLLAAASEVVFVDLMLLCCGVAQRPGETRLQLLQRNAFLFREVVPKVIAAAPDAVLVVGSNPVDLMTDLTARIARLPSGRVIGSSTILDGARLRALVAEHVWVASRSVHTIVLREHGDSEVLVWLIVQVGVFPLASYAAQVGRPVTDQVKQQIDEKVRRAGYRWLEENGFASVNEIRGRCDATHFKPVDTFLRTQYRSTLADYLPPGSLHSLHRLEL